MLIDRVWMLVNEESSQPNVAYCIESNPQALWAKVIREEILGTGTTKKYLTKQGWRAKKVEIHLPTS